jgi:hypothetical protein
VIKVLNMTLQPGEGVEFVVIDDAEDRKGLDQAHSYFVAFGSDPFGPRVADLLSEIEDLAEDVHRGWRRAPKHDLEDVS